MIDEEILEIASKHLRYFEDGWRGTEWSATPEHLLKFARAIYSEGFSDGCKEGSYSDYTWMRP